MCAGLFKGEERNYRDGDLCHRSIERAQTQESILEISYCLFQDGAMYICSDIGFWRLSPEEAGRVPRISTRLSAVGTLTH